MRARVRLVWRQYAGRLITLTALDAERFFLLDSIVGQVVSLMEILGSLGIGLAILIETVFPPVPSEVILPLAGFASAQGDLNVFAAFGAATAGSLAGTYILYWLGAAIGAQRLRAIADRIWLVEAADVDRALAWFDRYGEASVLVGRLMPGVRSLVSIPAGVHRMGLGRFTALTLAGSAVWNAALIWLGAALGSNWRVVSHTIDQYSTWVYAALLLGAGGFFVMLVRRSVNREARQESSH